MKKARAKKPKYAPLGLATALPYLASWLTGAPREKMIEGRDFEWSPHSWTHNAFRVWELIFWRRAGIRAELSSRIAPGPDGKMQVTYACHSWESVFALGETFIREFFGRFKLVPVRIYIPALATGGPVFQSPYLLALAFDTATHGEDNATTVTWSHTSTGSNLVATEYNIDYGGDLTSSVTYNSVSLTQVRKKVMPGTVVAGGYVYGNILIAPATGAHNFVITASTSDIKRGVAMTYSGAKQSGQPDASNDASGTSTGSQTVSVTVVASGCYLTVGIADFDNTAGDAMVNGTARIGSNDATAGPMIGGDSNGTVGTGAQTIGRTMGASTKNWVFIAMSIAPNANSYNQTVSATGAGTAAVHKAITKATTTLQGIGAGIGKVIKSTGKPLHATGAGTAKVYKQMARTLTALGAGTAILIATKVYLQSLTALGAATATLAKVPGKALKATGAGVATVKKSAHKTLTAVGAGIGKIIKQGAKTLHAIAQGHADVMPGLNKTLHATAVAIGKLTKSPLKTLAATGVGTATIEIVRQKTLAAIAEATANVAKVAGKLIAGTANAVGRIRQDFWKTKYPPTGDADGYDVKYPHGS